MAGDGFLKMSPAQLPLIRNSSTMKFSIITMLGAVTPLLNAVALAVRADELPGTLYFHNEQGVVAGRCVCVQPSAPEMLRCSC